MYQSKHVRGRRYLQNTKVGEVRVIILKFILRTQNFEGETQAEGFREHGSDGLGGKGVMIA